MKGRIISTLFSDMSLRHSKKCLAQWRCSINLYWINGGLQTRGAGGTGSAIAPQICSNTMGYSNFECGHIDALALVSRLHFQTGSFSSTMKVKERTGEALPMIWHPTMCSGSHEQISTGRHPSIHGTLGCSKVEGSVKEVPASLSYYAIPARPITMYYFGRRKYQLLPFVLPGDFWCFLVDKLY